MGFAVAAERHTATDQADFRMGMEEANLPGEAFREAGVIGIQPGD